MGFTIIDADLDCWDGDLSTFEQRLLRPLPMYALEQLRTRFLYAVTTTREPTKIARSVLQMAFDTEISTVLVKLITLAPGALASRVCERRRFIEIDADMQLFKFLWAPALDAVRERDFIPLQYVELLERHYEAEYPRYRMSAIAALLCLAATYLVEDA